MWLRSHTELDVYRKAFDAAMQIFRLSKEFPSEERFRLLIKFVELLDQFVPTL